MAGWDESFRRWFNRASGEEVHDSAATPAAPAGERSIWSGDVPVTGQRLLPPDARMMQAIGKNHSLESAIADIVDNSLDAHAANILVRFVRDRDELIGVYIVDDGDGMDDIAIDQAMTFGGQRTYGDAELGHFGIGLKAASFGQAKNLTVLSRTKARQAVGRRLLVENAARGFECDIVSDAYAATVLNRHWGPVNPITGTVVIWNDVRCFPRVVLRGAVDAFLDDTIRRLVLHLGLVFHRIIAAIGVRITIDQEDVGAAQTGPPFLVKPIDPFGYAKSGRADYPRLLAASSASSAITLRCHIWPGRANDLNFRLPGGRPDQFQGFFIYRNNRLLQAGGWHGVTGASDDLQLARVAVDMPPVQSGLFEMNPEKTRVDPTDRFVALVHAATDADLGFPKFLEDAIHTYRESRKRTRQRPKVLPPGAGLVPAVKSAIGDEFDFLPGRDALGIRWAPIEGEDFLEFDKEASLIKLNRRYRTLVVGEGRASLNDAPLVKALIYLLGESVLRGENLGPRDKDNISIWQAILTAAIQAEMKRDRPREDSDTSTDKDSNTT